MSFLKSLEKEQAKNLFLLRAGHKSGRRAWWFVMVEPHKVNRYLKACAQGPIHIPDYGKIIRSGFGESPPEEVMQEIKAQYGLGDDAFSTSA